VAVATIRGERPTFTVGSITVFIALMKDQIRSCGAAASSSL